MLLEELLKISTNSDLEFGLNKSDFFRINKEVINYYGWIKYSKNDTCTYRVVVRSISRVRRLDRFLAFVWKQRDFVFMVHADLFRQRKAVVWLWPLLFYTSTSVNTRMYAYESWNTSSFQGDHEKTHQETNWTIYLLSAAYKVFIC